jgi:hypothetical protein
VRDARDPEREFTKNTRHAFFSAFTSSSSFVVVVVVFVADDDDDETVADGETTSSIGSPSSALRARSEARTKTQRERNKKERNSEREDEAFVGLFSRASVSVCVCSFKGVQRVVQLSKRDCIFLSPGQIFLLFTDQSIRNGVSTRALRSPIYRNKAEL